MKVPKNPTSTFYDEDPSRLPHPESPPSLESQLLLREIRDYVFQCHSILDEIVNDFDGFRINPEDSGFLSRTAERLGRICLESDSWGFDFLYDEAFTLQKIILESSGSESNSHFQDIIPKSLARLSMLVEQCELDFRRQLIED
jgi:hypothetical protein